MNAHETWTPRDDPKRDWPKQPGVDPWGGCDERSCARCYVQDEDRTERTVWRVVAADLDALAGRVLTDDELATIEKAIGYSTAMEAVAAAVEQVAGLPDDEDDG